MLVDQGKVKWDDPATKYLPGFQIYDPYVTREITVRDLLSHRSGLARGDMLWYAAQDLPRDSILYHVRYLKPSWSLRSRFGYQNIMYLAAGQLAARVNNKSWDQVIRERIFQPLGMTSSNTSTKDLERLPDVASPHEEIEDTVRVIPYHNIDNIAPAGSINSNAVDMAQWVRFQLARGKVGGKPLLSAGAFDEMHTPQTIMPLEGPWKLMMQDAHFGSYGMGWILHDYHGRKIVQHGGNIDGMHALVGLMPEEKTGLVILTNLGGNFLTYALMYRVFDAFLKNPPKDWSAQLHKGFEELVAQGKAEEKKREAGQSRRGPRPRCRWKIRRHLRRQHVRRSVGETGRRKAGAALRHHGGRPGALAARHLPRDLAGEEPGQGLRHLRSRCRQQGGRDEDGGCRRVQAQA